MDPVEAPRSPARPWSGAKKVSFRLAFVFLILYNLPFPLYAFWRADPDESGYAQIWGVIVPWVGRHLGIAAAAPQPSGSGDSTFNC